MLAVKVAKEFGEYIRAHREAKNYSVAHLAMTTSLSPQVVEALEKGSYEPTILDVKRLSRELSVQPMELLFEAFPHLCNIGYFNQTDRVPDEPVTKNIDQFIAAYGERNGLKPENIEAACKMEVGQLAQICQGVGRISVLSCCLLARKIGMPLWEFIWRTPGGFKKNFVEMKPVAEVKPVATKLPKSLKPHQSSKPHHARLMPIEEFKARWPNIVLSYSEGALLPKIAADHGISVPAFHRYTEEAGLKLPLLEPAVLSAKLSAARSAAALNRAKAKKCEMQKKRGGSLQKAIEKGISKAEKKIEKKIEKSSTPKPVVDSGSPQLVSMALIPKSKLGEAMADAMLKNPLKSYRAMEVAFSLEGEPCYVLTMVD